MKEKIIQIVRNIASASGDSLADVADIYEENYFKKEIDELSTLIQEERKEAVEGFVAGYINQLRISPRKENVAPLLRFKKEYLKESEGVKSNEKDDTPDYTPPMDIKYRNIKDIYKPSITKSESEGKK